MTQLSIKLVWAVLLMGITLTASGTGWFAASISQIEIDSSGYINIYFSANSECGSSRLTYTNVLIGNDDAKAMLATLLSWQAQSKQISVFVPGASPILLCVSPLPRSALSRDMQLRPTLPLKP